MMKYEPFYRKYGTRLLKDIVYPKILVGNTFQFPRLSRYFNLVISDSPVELTRKDMLLLRAEHLVVNLKTELTGEQLGTVRKVPKMVNSLISELSKKDKSIIYKKPNMPVTIKPNASLVVNHYGYISEFYKYSINILNRYYKYRNIVSASIKDMCDLLATENDPNKLGQIFINIDLPNELPSRNQLDNFIKGMNVSFLKKLPNYRYLHVLELWKLFTPEKRTESVFNQIPEQYLNKIDLLFNLDTKVVVVNLGLLLSLIKDYNLNISSESFDTNIALLEDSNVNISLEDLKIKQKFTPAIFKKLFYVFIYKIINFQLEKINPKSLISKIKENFADDSNMSMVSNEKPDVVNIDDVLDKEVIEEDDEDTTTEIKRDKAIKLSNKKEQEAKENEEDYDMDYETDTDLDAVNLSETLANNNTNTVYTNLSDLLDEEPDMVKNINKKLDVLKESGVVSNKEYNNIQETLKTQSNIKLPYIGAKDNTLKDVLDLNKDVYTVSKEETVVTDNKAVLDKSYNNNKIGNVTKKYIDKQLKKDIVRSVFALQNNNCVIEDYNVIESDSILGGMEEHNIALKMFNGKRFKFKLNLPKIEEDGTFKISSNTYRMRMQKTELPYRKINTTTVALNSYYGKYFVSKARSKQKDASYAIYKKVMNLFQNSSTVKSISPSAGAQYIDKVLPNHYDLFSKYISSIVIHDSSFNFTYNNRQTLFPDIDLKQLEGRLYILVGKYKDTYPIVMDKDSKLYIVERNQYKPTDDLLKLLNIQVEDIPLEVCELKIMKEHIPLAVLLGYYMGLDNLLKTLNVKYETFPVNKQPPYDKNLDFVIKFKDVKLKITRTNDYRDLITASLVLIEKVTKEFINYSSLNTRDGYSLLFNKLGYKLHILTEIKLLEEMFIDPITLSILKEIKGPLTFKGLLIKAAELIGTNQTLHPNDVSGTAIKGYERLPGMMYKTMVTAMKDYENTAHFSKGKLTVNPFSILGNITEDSTTVLVDDLNPIATIKQTEDVSYLGDGGRGSKLSMSKDTRVLHDTEIGLVSEAAKDNGDVGITFYLTADPNLDGTRGICLSTDASKSSWANLLSTPNMVMAFATHDDVKRINKVCPAI